MKENETMNYLVIKRFAWDDVPVFLKDDFAEAEQEVKNIEKQMDAHKVYATEAEQNLMKIDISSNLLSVVIITFGDDGRPLID